MVTNPMQSPIANQRPCRFRRRRRIEPWGICFHTTGRGILKRALRQELSPIEAALKWYRSRYAHHGSVHYVIDHDGTIHQMLDDDRRGAHVGIGALNRRRYLSGRWVATVASSVVLRWRRRWPGYKSPQHLYPTRGPNGCYVGVEMIPLAIRNRDGLWFTPEQHRAAGELARDLADRHDWPKNWRRTPRLVGHEDLAAHSRWDSNGGWDPGALRLRPRFDWRQMLEASRDKETCTRTE